jgi:hypothetical protein
LPTNAEIQSKTAVIHIYFQTVLAELAKINQNNHDVDFKSDIFQKFFLTK